jgi:hypothetical protein
MGLITPNVERKTQLYFRDDNKFQFIKRDLRFSCLVERKGDAIKKGWKHFYGCQLPFPGYKGISPDMVTLGFSRDIILDPFDKVPKGAGMGNKPDLKTKDSLIQWIAKIAENQRHTYRAKRESASTADKIVYTEIGVIFIMVLFWGIAFIRGIYG